jgi:hypothetical protein
MNRVDTRTLNEVARCEVVECRLCGTRLRHNEPDRLEVGSDSLLTVAEHRCAPRITTRHHA